MIAKPLVALAFFLSGLFAAQAQEANCSVGEAYPSLAWKTIKPARQPVEVMIANQAGWEGLGKLTLKRQAKTRGALAAIPWLSPALENVFDEAHALTRISNPQPTFYLHWMHEYLAPDPGSLSRIEVVRVHTTVGERFVKTMSGRTTLTEKPGFDRRDRTKISTAMLDDSTVEVRVLQPLGAGEYMLFLNPAAAEGFDFTETCSTHR